jgi:hypothetical protein
LKWYCSTGVCTRGTQGGPLAQSAFADEEDDTSLAERFFKLAPAHLLPLLDGLLVALTRYPT